MSIEDAIRGYAEQAVRQSAACVQTKRRATAPRDSGDLAGSIDATYAGRRGDTYWVTVTQDENEAPHGQIINNPTGGRITAKNGKALGPFNHAGQTMFRQSVQQSTVHRGWWDQYEWRADFEDCLNQEFR